MTNEPAGMRTNSMRDSAAQVHGARDWTRGGLQRLRLVGVERPALDG